MEKGHRGPFRFRRFRQEYKKCLQGQLESRFYEYGIQQKCLQGQLNSRFYEYGIILDLTLLNVKKNKIYGLNQINHWINLISILKKSAPT